MTLRPSFRNSALEKFTHEGHDNTFCLHCKKTRLKP